MHEQHKYGSKEAQVSEKITSSQWQADIPKADLDCDIIVQPSTRVLENQLCNVSHNEFLRNQTYTLYISTLVVTRIFLWNLCALEG